MQASYHLVMREAAIHVIKSNQLLIHPWLRLLFYETLNPEDPVEEINRFGPTSPEINIAGEIEIVIIPG